MKPIFKSNSPKAVVFGGSGFIGRYIVNRLIRSGYMVRVAVRKPNDALFLKTYGEVGQIEIVGCSILNIESVRKCLEGSSVVINNHFWLHGRKPFRINENLSRELLRVRGSFNSTKNQ